MTLRFSSWVVPHPRMVSVLDPGIPNPLEMISYSGGDWNPEQGDNPMYKGCNPSGKRSHSWREYSHFQIFSTGNTSSIRVHVPLLCWITGMYLKLAWPQKSIACPVDLL